MFSARGPHKRRGRRRRGKARGEPEVSGKRSGTEALAGSKASKRLPRERAAPTPTPPPVVVSDSGPVELDPLDSEEKQGLHAPEMEAEGDAVKLHVVPLGLDGQSESVAPPSLGWRWQRGRELLEGVGVRRAVVLWALTVVAVFAIILPWSEDAGWPGSRSFDTRALGGGMRGLVLPALEAEADAPKRVQPSIERADARMYRDRHSGFAGGIVFVPKTFSSHDGQFDLLLHFHGNTGVVRESAEVAGLNAIVAVINLGEGSAPYEEAYAMPRTYEKLLERIERIVRDRGLRDARIRRVALSSWSAGYGAISTILDVRKGQEPLDAVLVLDGIHCGYVDPAAGSLNPLQLEPFLGAARRAAGGEILFSITHTDIEPKRYASASETASYLLESIGGTRVPRYAEPGQHVSLVAAEGAVAKKLEKRMWLTSEGQVGSFHVRGYRGETPEHHMAHLLQVATTLLPELALRWNASTPVR